MLINNKVKILIIVLIGAVIVYLFFMRSKPAPIIQTSENFTEIEQSEIPHINYALDDMETESNKLISKNRACGEYKKSDYAGGIRGNLGNSTWDQYFDQNNNLIGDSQVNDIDFVPRDETIPIDAQGQQPYASFYEAGKKATCGSNQDCNVEDLFNADHYLPKEQNDEWWNTLEQSIPIKDRHLVNINKPIGINTIGSSLKNPSYDIRGTPANPKFAISPFNNSSIDPDTNIKAWNY